MPVDAQPWMDALRDGDPDRHLAILYAPAEHRAALAALYAFNLEIASLRDKVREPMAGEIRLQWWREALASGREIAAGNPLAVALVEAAEHHGLPHAALDAYLEARIFDLYDDPLPTRTDLEGYCGETASALIQLSALVLEPEAALSFAGAAGHAGCAQAIAGLLRLLPHHRARGQCYVPVEMLAAAGVDRDAFLTESDHAGGARAVAMMAELGREHLAAFEREADDLPSSLRPAFLPVAPVEAYLDRISRRPEATLTTTQDISPMRRHWLILRRAVRGWGAR